MTSILFTAAISHIKYFHMNSCVFIRHKHGLPGLTWGGRTGEKSSLLGNLTIRSEVIMMAHSKAIQWHFQRWFDVLLEDRSAM